MRRGEAVVARRPGTRRGRAPAGADADGLYAPLLLAVVLVQHEEDGGVRGYAGLLLEGVEVLLPGDAALNGEQEVVAGWRDAQSRGCAKK